MQLLWSCVPSCLPVDLDVKRDAFPPGVKTGAAWSYCRITCSRPSSQTCPCESRPTTVCRCCFCLWPSGSLLLNTGRGSGPVSSISTLFPDAHRLHHVSSLAWLDEHTLVTTSHDASVKEWTITYWGRRSPQGPNQGLEFNCLRAPFS
jgi:hypothetical protein